MKRGIKDLIIHLLPINFFHGSTWATDKPVASKLLYEKLSNSTLEEAEKSFSKILPTHISNSEKHLIRMGLSYEEKKIYSKVSGHLLTNIRRLLKNNVLDLVRLSHKI